MKFPTLDEFITRYKAGGDPGRPINGWVREPGFRHLYVRMTPRYISGIAHDPTLDLANFEVRKPGHGTFTALINRLRSERPELTLFVECVLNGRLAKRLEALGFEYVGSACFVWYGKAG